VADKVRLHISPRILKAVADARLRSEMDDAINRMSIDETIKSVRVGKVSGVEAEAVPVLPRQAVEPRSLQ
jgi:hypothetical protein